MITGVRRCGKTILLSQIKDLLIEKNGIKKENIIEINFESAKYDNLRDANELYHYICSIEEKKNEKIYIFIDEIQEVNDWQKIVNSFRVDFDCDIYITGSNSKHLSGELATYLTGRYVQIMVYPFTFSELKEMYILHNKFTTNEALFADYLKYGSFPQRCYFDDDQAIVTFLKDLYETIVIKDIIGRHHIKDIAILRKVVNFMLDNIANPFSARKIVQTHESYGTKIDLTTLLNYIEYIKESYIIYNANRYDIVEKNYYQLKKNIILQILA